MDAGHYPRLGQVGHDFRKVAHAEASIHTLPREHRVSLLIQGEGTGNTGPVKIIPERPAVWLTPANTPETLSLHGQIDLWTFTFEWPDFRALSIGSDELELTCYGKQRRTCRIKHADMTDASRMIESFKLLQRSSGRWEMTGELEVRSHMLLLIAFYTDLPEVPSTSGVHRSLEQFHVLLDEHAFDPVSIKKLAEQANMSAEYLRFLFYKRFGVQPHTYRASLRMNKARQLLSERKMSVKEVAHLVGYDDPLYFSRVFKKRYGLTPSELMNRSQPADHASA